MASKAAKIWKRTWVGLLLAGALAALLWASFGSTDGFVVWGVGVGITFGAVYEVGRMTALASRGVKWALFLALAATCYTGELNRFVDGVSIPEFLSPASASMSYAVALGATLVTGVFVTRKRLPLLMFFALWLFVPLPALWYIWEEFGPKGLTALLLLSKIGDILGYYFGSAIGKSHPFPGISPGKTTAGCVASLVGGTVAGGACVAAGLLPGGTSTTAILAGLGAGAIVNIAAQAGDLLESKVKRSAGVKDSGTWFGPSGGVLDLVDSLLLSVPAALLSWPLLFG
jgi:phosphatidate cytidylyltransferase